MIQPSPFEGEPIGAFGEKPVGSEPRRFMHGKDDYGELLESKGKMTPELKREIDAAKQSAGYRSGSICYFGTQRVARAFIEQGRKTVVLLKGTCCTWQEIGDSLAD